MSENLTAYTAEETAAHRKLWTDALRSDEYKQGDKALSEGMQEEAVEHFKKAKAAMPKE